MGPGVYSRACSRPSPYRVLTAPPSTQSTNFGLLPWAKIRGANPRSVSRVAGHSDGLEPTRGRPCGLRQGNPSRDKPR